MPDVVRDVLGSLWFWLVVFVVFLGLAYSVQKMPTKPRPGARSEQPAVCAWCVWRAGDVCNGEGSPVFEGECEPVCVGRLTCKVCKVM